jgi:hypothetical protein
MINATHSFCRTKAIAFIALLLSLTTAWAQADEVVVAKLPVESDTCYRLKFKARTGREKAEWLLRTIDRDGEIPHAGCYEQDWQKIVLGTTTYAHSLRTPPGAETLEFAVRCDGQQPQVSDVKLEPITPEGLLVNGDFTDGPDNYSGWSEHNNTSFVEVNGKTALKIEHNGYALTDRAPVEGGVLYQFASGSTMPAYVLAYNADMHLLTPTQYNRKR